MANVTTKDEYQSSQPSVHSTATASSSKAHRPVAPSSNITSNIFDKTPNASTYYSTTTDRQGAEFVAGYSEAGVAATVGVTTMFSDTDMLQNQYWGVPSGFNYTNGTMSPGGCDAMLEDFKEHANLKFTYANLVNISVTWSVFLLSAIGNFFVLSSVTVRRKRKHMSHSQLMMMHLTFANLAFTFFILPMDAIWHTTLEWYGGDFLCRIMNILKQFAMYISSAMIVVMGVDRVASLMCPMSLAMQRQRIKIMLATAWGFSFLNAIPAGVIFSFVHFSPYPDQCPDSVVMQCIDLNVQKKANLQPYYVYTMFVSFFGPLICILICYIFIAVSISRMARISKEAQKRCSLKNRGSHKSVTKRSLDRARRVSQLVTGLITAVFVICWGPYYVAGLIYWFDENNSTEENKPEKLSDLAHVLMLTSMYLNPCLHPLITVLLMKEVRDNVLTQCRRGSNQGSRMIPRNPNPPKKKIVIKDDKNGTRELLPKQNGNGRGGVGADMHWV